MEGVLFSDLPAICKEKELLSPVSRKNFWQTVEYETSAASGVLLSAKSDNMPAPLTLLPELVGWYRIYVGIVACIGQTENNTVHIKLGNDRSYVQLKASSAIEGGGIEEVFWKCADLTGQAVVLWKGTDDSYGEDCMLGWLRFEPMTEAEIAAFAADAADLSHKKIYATNDMHVMTYAYAAAEQKLWDMVVESYEQSDVEWLSVESLFLTNSPTPLPIEAFSFDRCGDKNVQRAFNCGAYSHGMLRNLVAYGHKKGLKMCMSQRMGLWCMPFPLEGINFDNVFWKAHPELQCMDRDGADVTALSYAFPEVQDYVIGLLLEIAGDGFDAVELMFHRGAPYVLFEEPFCRRFTEKYGEDPRFLPWTDERIIDTRCEILTGFVARLRTALNEAGFSGVRIHLRGLHSLYDNRLLGIDPERLAAEKLVDTLITHPLAIRERLTGDVWQADNPGYIDLAKFTRYANESNRSIYLRREGFGCANDERRMLYDPVGEEPIPEPERIRQWAALEKQYGVQVCFEIMPRNLSAAEYRRRILEIFDAGGARISLWDTYGRVAKRYTWNLLRNAGHPDRIRAANPGPDGYSARYRFLRTGPYPTGRFRPHWGA